MEIYDFWSNCSHIIDLTSFNTDLGAGIGVNTIFSKLFNFSNYTKNYTHTSEEGGQKYGMPYDNLT
jgi:hypothetical protein